MHDKRTYHWRDGKTLQLGEKTIVMGILNGTPDSFSDGGKYNTIEGARQHLQEVIAAGADIVDVGFESTRPGHTQISEEEEIERMKALLPMLVEESTVPLSIDTYRAKPAAYALSQGVHILNDIWGLQYDPDMAAVAKEYDVPICVMHNQQEIAYTDIMEDMKRFFDTSFEISDRAGISRDKIWLDPGLGFGKAYAEDVEVLRRLKELTTLPYPVLVGPSRKRFIGALLNGLPFTERDEGTASVCVTSASMGVSIVRVHNVEATARALAVYDGIWGNLKG